MAIVGCPLFGSRYLRSAMNVQFHARPRFMNHPSWSHITTTIRVITSDTTTFRVTPSQVSCMVVWDCAVVLQFFDTFRREESINCKSPRHDTCELVGRIVMAHVLCAASPGLGIAMRPSALLPCWRCCGWLLCHCPESPDLTDFREIEDAERWMGIFQASIMASKHFK